MRPLCTLISSADLEKRKNNSMGRLCKNQKIERLSVLFPSRGPLPEMQAYGPSFTSMRFRRDEYVVNIALEFIRGHGRLR